MGLIESQSLDTPLWSVNQAGVQTRIDVPPGSYLFQFPISIGETVYVNAFAGSNAGDARRGVWRIHDGMLSEVYSAPEVNIRGELFGGPSSSAVFGEVDGQLLLRSADWSYGRELWSTDGTPTGTGLVKDIHTGGRSSNPRDLSRFGDRLFFVADGDETGPELFVTDGSRAGTQHLVDLNPGVAASSPEIAATTQTAVYFSADVDGNPGFFRSDGDETIEILPQSYVWSATPWRDGLLAVAVDEADLFDSAERRLVSIDVQGQGVTTLREGPLISNSTNPIDTSRDDGLALFMVENSQSELELWAIDAPGSELRLIKNFGMVGSTSGSFIIGERDATYIGFSRADGNFEIWFSDGAPARQLLALADFPRNPAISNGELYFNTGAESYNRSLQRLDSNGEITELAIIDDRPANVIVQDGVVYLEFNKQEGFPYGVLFSNQTDHVPFGRRHVLYRVDGTDAGTVELANRLAYTIHGTSATFVQDSTLYAIRRDAAGDSELWKVSDDGLSVQLVAAAGVKISSPVEFLNGYALFGAEDQAGDAELYKLRLNRPVGWHNEDMAQDVDGNQIIAPQDAILIINELVNRRFSDAESGFIDGDNLQTDRYLDVNDDGIIAATDIVPIINELAMRLAAPLVGTAVDTSQRTADMQQPDRADLHDSALAEADPIEPAQRTNSGAEHRSVAKPREIADQRLPRRTPRPGAMSTDRLFAELGLGLRGHDAR